MGSKKIAIDIMVIILAILLFIIWHQNFIVDKARTTFSNVEFYNIYLITTDKEYEYWYQLNQGAEDMANLMGVNYIWDAPDERNVYKQIEVINRAVERGAYALLVAADDPKFISGVVEDAKARGVRVIYVDSPAFEEAITTLATDNYQAGVIAGQTMISSLDRSGYDSGSIGIVSYSDKANTELREMGFRDALARDTRYKVLETIYTLRGDIEESQMVAEQLMNENEDLIALFGTNEGTSEGVGNAIKAKDNQYIGVGFDSTEAMRKLLNEGSLKAIIVQNPYTMGYLGMAQAVAAILGKDTGPEYIDTGVSVISSE